VQARARQRELDPARLPARRLDALEGAEQGNGQAGARLGGVLARGEVEQPEAVSRVRVGEGSPLAALERAAAEHRREQLAGGGEELGEGGGLLQLVQRAERARHEERAQVAKGGGVRWGGPSRHGGGEPAHPRQRERRVRRIGDARVDAVPEQARTGLAKVEAGRDLGGVRRVPLEQRDGAAEARVQLAQAAELVGPADGYRRVERLEQPGEERVAARVRCVQELAEQRHALLPQVLQLIHRGGRRDTG